MIDGPRIELVNRRHVCRNARFDVFLDEIVDEHGCRVRDYLSVVPLSANADGVTGVAVLPLRDDGRVGLMPVFRHPQGAPAWEIPKGFIELGEAPANAARRELFEETGLVATEVKDLGHLTPEPGLVRARVRLFAGYVIELADASPEVEVGHGKIEFFPQDKAFALAHAGHIEEACSLVALYRMRDRS
jgi:8-oxo-dGTP pyrophosphatase MutT (NUDIX family)